MNELSFVVFSDRSVIETACNAPKSDSICGTSLPKEVSRGGKRASDLQSYIIGWNNHPTNDQYAPLSDHTVLDQDSTDSTPHKDATTDS